MKLKKEIYEIELTTTTPLLGSQPPTQEVWERHILKKIQKEIEKVEKMIDVEQRKTKEILRDDHPLMIQWKELKEKEEKIKKGLLDDIPETDEKITVFPRAEIDGKKVLVMRSYQILGLFKETAHNFFSKDIRGAKNLVSKYLNVRPYNIPLCDDEGNYVDNADDILERILRAMTPAGFITSPIKSEVLNPPIVIRFKLSVWGAGKLNPYTEEVIREALEIASEQVGLLQWRSSGEFGRFEITHFEKIGEEVVKPKTVKLK